MKISIIVPVYNSTKYLRTCLDSVLAQTYRDWECICVDDGSTDGSGEILEEYKRADDRFVVIHRENGGVGAARNTALDCASGDYVTFLDNDDILNRHWFESAAKFIEAESPDLLHMEYQYLLEPPAGFAEARPDAPCEVLQGAEAFRYAWKIFPSRGYVWICFIRRAIIGNDRLVTQINGKEDGVFLLTLAPRLKKVCCNCFAGYFYRATPGSLLKRNRGVEQCLSYVKAYSGLWKSQTEYAKACDAQELLKARITYSVRHDIIEWICRRKQGDTMDRNEIRREYLKLIEQGCIEGVWSDKIRFLPGFILWRYTGALFGVALAGFMFLYIRKCLNRIFFIPNECE